MFRPSHLSERKGLGFMRVAVMAGSIVPGRSCGIEHFTYGLLNSILAYVPKVELFVIIPRNSEAAWIGRVPRRLNVKFLPLTLSASISVAVGESPKPLLKACYGHVKKSRLAKDLFWRLRLWEEYCLLRKLKPDVVYYPFHLDRIHPKLAGKSVVTVHDLRELQPEFYNQQNANVIRANVRVARAVVSSWKHPFDHLHNLFPEVEEKSFLVPFPPAMGCLGPSEPINPPEPGGEEIVLYVSITSPHKNHVRLVQAMARVIERRPGRPIRLVCAGTKLSPGYNAALEEARKLGIPGRVEFTGFIPDEALHQLYRRAKMVVAPTLWEAASGTVYEAFLYGKPVACSRIPPLVSQVEQAGARVRFFNPLDPEDMAQAILEVLDNPEPYNEGALRGAAFLRSLSWEKTAKEYLDIFTKIAEGGARCAESRERSSQAVKRARFS